MLGVLASLIGTYPVKAQSSASGDAAASSGSSFEEVVVTARKREEKAQSVPIAMDVLTPVDLENKNIKSIQDIRYVSPSVYIQADQFQQDTVNITIRGLRNFPSNGVQFDTAAAVYIDGVYIARTQGLAASLYDVANIDVLKGPQGTLVGRNSTGGALLYTTKEPTQNFEGYLDLTAGDYDKRQAEGAINIPISEFLSVRGAFSYDNQGGYLKNLYTDPATGAVNNTPALGYRRLAGRLTAEYKADDFKLVLRADGSEEHDSGSAYHDLGYFTGTVASLGRPSICNIPGTCNTVGGTSFTDLFGHVVAPYYTSTTTFAKSTNPASYNAVLNSVARQANDFWTTDQELNAEDTDHFETLSAAADQGFEDFDVKLIGSWRHYNSNGFVGSRGLPYVTIETLYNVPDYNAYSSELTFNGSSFGDSLKWTAGFFYFNESSPDSGSLSYLYSPNYPVPAAISGHQVTLTDTSRNGGDNSSYAGYAQATYSILPDLRLTAGARYTIDERNADISTTSVRFPATAATTAALANSVFNPGTYTLNGITYKGVTTSCGLTDANGKLLPPASCAFNVSKDFHKPTWTVSLDYDLADHTLVYFTTRSGYRSGAINTGAANPNFTIAQPEEVQDYELGIKSEWKVFDIPFRTNFDVYDTDYSNIQVQVSLPNAIFATNTVNGGACTQALFNNAQCTGTTNDSVTLNAKSAHIYGYEWDFQAKPTPDLALSWSGSYLHARYTDFTYTVPAGYLLPAGGAGNLTGSPFPLPQWEMNASATYQLTGEELGLPVDDVSFTANWYWQSKFLAVFTGFQFPAQQAAGYGMTNLHFAVDNIMGSNVSIGGYVSNLFNKKACYPESGSTGGGGAGVLNSAPNATFGTANTSGVLQCVPLAPQMFGFNVKYAFGGPSGETETKQAEYVPPPVVAPAPAPKSYLVFFDFNKSDLTPQAVSIVDTAAHNAAPMKVTQLTVTGHTDTVGSDAYNMRLSRRRAESVAAQLEKDGIPSSEIEIVAKGKRDLLVPTADGVKEPQNRRVQIVYDNGATS
jgi:iron complex outermembrane receptor protein